MSKKAALGRGLNALLPAGEEPEVDEDELGGGAELSKTRLYHFDERARLAGRVAEIELELIRPNPYQPRKDFDETALEELAASIRSLGIIQPVTVRALDRNQYEIISGERRLRAARRAGLQRIPAYIREADTEAMLEMALVENVQREELNPIEVAVGYQRLIEECSLTQEQVAQKVGKSRVTIANMLRLLKLPPRVQASLRDGNVTIGHARALISVEDEHAQLVILKEVEELQLSVREVEERVRAYHQSLIEPDPEPEPEVPARQEPELSERDALQLQEFTTKLRSLFSTQVSIRRKTDGGRIEIAFYSDDDLERIMELITRD